MSRARKGSHRYVYADPGTDWEREALNDSPALQPKEPAMDDGPPVPPEKLCPHDGIYVSGVPRCGYCFKQANNGLTPDDSFTAFQLSLYDICKRAAHKHRSFKSIWWEDMVQHAFCVLIQPANLLRLMNPKTKNPHGLAWSIVNRRLQDLIKKPVYWKEWNATSLKFPDEDEEGDDLTTNTARLDRIAAPSDMELTLEQKLLDSESVRYFPGVKLLWNHENIRRFMDLVKESMAKLPTEPFSISMLVKLRAGCLEGCGGEPWTWEEVAKFLSPAGGKKITVDQARYAFATGTDQIRRHLMRALTPRVKKIVPSFPK